MKFSEVLNKIFTPIPLGRWMGVNVFLHWSWWMMLIFLTAAEPMVASLFVGLFCIITLHELGHAWAAQRSNYQIDSVMLYLTGGVARVNSISLRNEVFITVCGLLVNIGLIPIFYLILSVVDQHPVMQYYFSRLAFLNFALLAFNAIPAYPLDAGRLLRAFLSLKVNLHQSTILAVTISSICSISLGFIAILVDKLILVVVALFVYYTAQQELQNLQDLQKSKIQNSLRESQQTIEKIRTKFDAIKKQSK